MGARVYSGAATPTTITGSITNVSTSVTIASATNWLTSGQFSVVIDPGLAGEEKCLATLSGTTLTFVTRGYDNTTAASHNSGAVIYPVPTAIDFSEANTHVNASSAVHGAAGTIVGTTDTQTLTNKDLSSSTNIFPAQIVAGKNAIINGGMDIWQRGTSFSSTGSIIYTADRWQLGSGVTSGQFTISQISSGLTGFQYAMRIQRNSGSTSTAIVNLQYNLESKESYRFAGQNVIVSFYARAGSNFSASSNTIYTPIISGTGTDQNINGGFTGQTTVNNVGQVLTTSWQRFTVSGSVASTATQLAFYFAATSTGTAGANDYFDITGVQLELGSTATTFSRAGGSIGGELALCQRYYQRIGAGSANSGDILFFGSAQSSTLIAGLLSVVATLRTSPSISTPTPSTSFRVYDGANVITPSAIGLYGGSPLQAISIAITVSGATQYRPYFLIPANAVAAYIEISAEL